MHSKSSKRNCWRVSTLNNSLSPTGVAATSVDIQKLEEVRNNEHFAILASALSNFSSGFGLVA